MNKAILTIITYSRLIFSTNNEAPKWFKILTSKFKRIKKKGKQSVWKDSIAGVK